MGVGRVALIEKNFEFNKMRDSSEGGIPSLRSGRLDKASALLKAPGLWIMEKWKRVRKRAQRACRRDSFCFVWK